MNREYSSLLPFPYAVNKYLPMFFVCNYTRPRCTAVNEIHGLI